MQDLSQIPTLLDFLYGSVLDDSQWLKSLSALGRYMRGNGTFYIAVDPRTGVALEADGVDADPAIGAEYTRHYSTIDVQVPPALAVPAGQFMTEYSLLGEGNFEASQIYGELYERWDIPHRVIVWIEKSPTLLAAISIQRSKARGRFVEGDFERYRPLMPHLRRAFRMRELLRSLRVANRLYFEAIDQLPFGVAFLNETGQVIELPRPTYELLKAAQSIGYKRQRIFALHSSDDRKLQRAIGRTLQFSADAFAPGGTVSVRKSNGRSPLSVAVIPFRAQPLPSLAPACMLIFFDPDISTRPAVTTLKVIFQLTQAEAVLASLLLTGITLREAAEQLQLSINTCKSQLKSVYGKTGCKNHVELAKVVLQSGVSLR